ncbi:MAG: MBOAT family O-acyltransferase [Alphaproteobacteria bacterium]
MSFVSFQWLAWLFSTVSLYWLSPPRFRDGILIGITILFLSIHSPVSLGAISILTAVCFLGTRVTEVSDARVLAVSGGILAILVYFKVAVYMGGDTLFQQTIIPLGLSYYSFRCFHYVFERYRDSLPEHGFMDFLSYLFFLPVMVMGPINRAEAFFEDSQTKQWSARDLSYGLERILYGYAKITILSGFLVNHVLVPYQTSLGAGHELLALYLGVVTDGLDLYFLFAGYSDIAIGFARLLGYRIMENFNWPYFQKNISDYWRCWHMSLSSWARDYVYFPVVGMTRNPYLGTLATFIVIGLWHEISPRYILWGIWHGAGILGWRKFQDIKRRLGLPVYETGVMRYVLDGFSILLTAHYAWFGLVLVSNESLENAMGVYAALFLGWW